MALPWRQDQTKRFTHLYNGDRGRWLGACTTTTSLIWTMEQYEFINRNRFGVLVGSALACWLLHYKSALTDNTKWMLSLPGQRLLRERPCKHASVHVVGVPMLKGVSLLTPPMDSACSIEATASKAPSSSSCASTSNSLTWVTSVLWPGQPSGDPSCCLLVGWLVGLFALWDVQCTTQCWTYFVCCSTTRREIVDHLNAICMVSNGRKEDHQVELSWSCFGLFVLDSIDLMAHHDSVDLYSFVPFSIANSLNKTNWILWQWSFIVFVCDQSKSNSQRFIEWNRFWLLANNRALSLSLFPSWLALSIWRCI